MNKNKSIFYSKKFLIFNIALASMIVGFVLSTLLIYACSNDGQARFKSAFAQDYDGVEKGFEALENIQYSFRNVADIALPVVVEINVTQLVSQTNPQSNSPWDFFFTPPEEGGSEQAPPEYSVPSLGSGVIVEQRDGKGYVITNNHVVGAANDTTAE